MRFLVHASVMLALVGTMACNGSDAPKSGAAASTTSAQPDIGEIIATVNGVPIGAKEFEQAAARKTPANGESLSAEEKKEVLDSLVEEKLLYAEALKMGLDKDPKVQKVMVNTLLREQVYATVKNSDFTDEMLQAYYDQHKSEFIVPEKVNIKRILIRVSDTRPDEQAKAEAEKLRVEVVAKPDSFKDVAARASEDPYKRRGGDIGFVAKDGKPGLDPVIVEKAFGMEVGSVSEVFKTSDGYNIIQVAARREQVERTFQQMKGSVLRKVKNDKMQSLYNDYVSKLRTGADIKIDQAKVDAIDVKSSRRAAVPNTALSGLEGEGMDEGMEGEGMEGEGALPADMGPGGRLPGAVGPGGKGRPEGKGEGKREGKGEGKRPGGQPGEQ